MQLAVRWSALGAVLASGAALVVVIAARPASESAWDGEWKQYTWRTFESHPASSAHFAYDQPAFERCLSSSDDRVAVEYFEDGAVRAVSAHLGSRMYDCLRHEYEYPHFANVVRVKEPALIGTFVRCARPAAGAIESLGKVVLDSREELARCGRQLYVEVSKVQTGVLVFDPADVPGAHCVADVTCGHRYSFGAGVAAQGITMSLP